MQDRSATAECAWASATCADAAEPHAPDLPEVFRLNKVRSRAMGEILDGDQPLSMTEKAIDALDHAYYAALAETGVRNQSTSA